METVSAIADVCSYRRLVFSQFKFMGRQPLQMDIARHHDRADSVGHYSPHTQIVTLVP